MRAKRSAMLNLEEKIGRLQGIKKISKVITDFYIFSRRNRFIFFLIVGRPFSLGDVHTVDWSRFKNQSSHMRCIYRGRLLQR